MVHVVVGIIRIRHGLCHQGVTDLEGLQAFLRAKLIGFLDELQGSIMLSNVVASPLAPL